MDDGDVTVTAASVDGRLALTAEYDRTVPYFGWVFNAPIRGQMRSQLRHIAAALEAVATNSPRPADPKLPWWAPPAAMSGDQIRVIATLSFALALVEYGNSLLTQTVDYVAKTYAATNAQLGAVTAVTRVGNLIVLVGGLLADRLGRRRLLMASVVIVLTATALSGAAPTLQTFGALQVLVNGGTNLAFMVAFIAAIEEAPEAARTYTLAIVTIAAGLGFAVGAILLPVADRGTNAWRALYAIGALGLLALPGISRRLTETKRFEALVARDAPTGRVAEVVDRRYGSRFALVCVMGFLLNLFFAPSSQFTNRYLGDERGFSAARILGLRAITQTVTALGGTYLGGRLAESRGRRVSAWPGLLVAAVGSAVFFTTSGPLLWGSLTIATAAGSMAGPAVSAFSTELFPTEVRGTAGAGQVIASVTGSATGLLLVGYLADPFGSVGRAVALTSIGLVLAIFVIRLMPEAAGRLLDEVSPPEV